jgi:hypothetical protein
MLLTLAHLMGSSSIETAQRKHINIKQEIGNQRFATLSATQKKLVADILNNLISDEERHHFFISFNHHYDITNNFRQESTVNINLSKLQYHDSSRISPKDIDHVIDIAHRHAKHY